MEDAIYVVNVNNNDRVENEVVFPYNSTFQSASNSDDLNNGKVNVLSEDNVLLASLRYDDNKLHGLCKYYENGVVNKEYIYENGKKEGWSREGNREFLYKNDCKVSELIPVINGGSRLEGYVYEVDIETNKRLRCFAMDSRHRINGIGYIFNDGKLVRKVQYKKNKEIMDLVVFEGNDMIEKDINGNEIYKGGYRIDHENVNFVREGYGREKRHECVYEGNWKNNKKEGYGKMYDKETLLYEGMWKNDVPEGEGSLYKADEMVFSGNWVGGVANKNEEEWKWKEEKGIFRYKAKKESVNKNKKSLKLRRSDNSIMNFLQEKLNNKRCVCTILILLILLLAIIVFLNLPTTISNSSELQRFANSFYYKSTTRKLIIDKSCCNDMKDDLVIDNFHVLKTIVVKGGSLQQLTSLKISDNSFLSSIEIESSAFAFVQTVIITGILKIN